MSIQATQENLAFFQCFSSATKLRIIELLGEKPQNIAELATSIGVSSTIITRHIHQLEDAGLVESQLCPGKRGLQKRCSLLQDTVTISLQNKKSPVSSPVTTTLSIPIGQYSDYQVMPTCGLSSIKSLIGLVDDPRYFSNPDRIHAALLWFGQGHVTYTIPSYLFTKQKHIASIAISMELCSEFPGYNNQYPSDIYFTLNNVDLGYYTSPGDFGDKKGIYTPSWWKSGTEYGLLKTITITRTGTYIDGNYMSTTTLQDIQTDFHNPMQFRIAVPEHGAHIGGLTLFGKGFGNYDQDIEITVTYADHHN